MFEFVLDLLFKDEFDVVFKLFFIWVFVVDDLLILFLLLVIVLGIREKVCCVIFRYGFLGLINSVCVIFFLIIIVFMLWLVCERGVIWFK